MRMDIQAENVLEWFLLRRSIPPIPLLHTLPPLLMVRAIMAGAKLGLFAALEAGPGTSRDVAARCGTHPRATAKLMSALLNCGYLDYDGSAYALTAMARKWLLPSDRDSLHESMLFRYAEWEMIEHLEAYLATGTPLDVHASDDGTFDWASYQRGMRSMAAITADEIAARLPVPRDARTMLDIGGSHGLYAVKLCRRHPGLSAVILDLPQAVRHAAPLLAAEGMGDRVVHRTGNALTEDLGAEAYDVVFTSQVVHHFDAETNRSLVARIGRALRPGGVIAIFDSLRPATPGEAGYAGALLDLYFAMTSESGTWSAEEMQGWQRDAGLELQPLIRPRTLPGSGLVVAKKPV